MHGFGKIAVALGMISLPVQAFARPQCLTHGEAEAVATAFLPALITNVRDQCRPLLPVDAALTTQGLEMAERYSGPALRARDVANPIVTRMIFSGENPPAEANFDPSTALDMVEAVIAVELAGELDADGCALANNIFSALEPLPAANFARLFVIFLDIGSRDDPVPGPFSLCREEEA
ncbi:hypothetical protein [Parasphingopyxis marina]|uniref:Uncharacterized protein n=1 Tax=Parasphingopyxis marina TaxID=2761622 RepID=A0A842HXJ4_9SPHN|nr:hypothetical protein [Parasphingopyxis marina]MBC2777816.1 hypothetical protein [Parasphingopyxis marina]